jgi:dissimilatory sulfite reductase (desulfoviridin) alpha/beta subunit
MGGVKSRQGEKGAKFSGLNKQSAEEVKKRPGAVKTRAGQSEERANSASVCPITLRCTMTLMDFEHQRKKIWPRLKGEEPVAALPVRDTENYRFLQK